MSPTISKMQQRVNNAAKGVENPPLGSDKPQAVEDILKSMPQNSMWSDLEDIYQKAMSAVRSAEGTLLDIIRGILSNAEMVKMIEDQVTMANTIQLLTKDLSSHLAVLDGIHAKHAGKTGGTQVNTKGGGLDMSEHQLALALYMDYHDAMSAYDAVNTPILIELTRQANEVVAKYNASLALEEAQNPNVITDVEVKDN